MQVRIYGNRCQVIQTLIAPALIVEMLFVVAVNARIKFVPANGAMLAGVCGGSKREILVFDTAAFMS